MARRFAAPTDDITLNADLFNRISTLNEHREELELDAEANRLLEKYYTGFVRAGARLSDEDKATLREMNGKIARLSTEFSQNVLREVNDSAVEFDSVDALAGLKIGRASGRES